MTNYEKHKSEIEKIVLEGENFGLVNNKVVACNGNYCNHCEFRIPMPLISCAGKRKEWLNAEHKEQEIDWEKVPLYTHVWVRDSENAKWQPKLYVKYRPQKGYQFVCTVIDPWIHANGVYERSAWNYCKLDDSVDPTPYYKEN